MYDYNVLLSNYQYEMMVFYCAIFLFFLRFMRVALPLM